MEKQQPLTEYKEKVREITDLHEQLLTVVSNGNSNRISHDSPNQPLWLYLKEIWGLEKRELEALDPEILTRLDNLAAFRILLGYLNPDEELTIDLEGKYSIEDFLRRKITELSTQEEITQHRISKIPPLSLRNFGYPGTLGNIPINLK